MAENQVFSWQDSPGWIVLSGGADPLSDIRALALSRASADGGVAYISLAPDSGDSLLDDMEDLGAPTGYIIDLRNEAPEKIEQQIGESSVVVVQPGQFVEEMTVRLRGAVTSGMQTALERGAVILLEGLAANAFGQFVISNDGELIEGLGWVGDAFIIPGMTSLAESSTAQDILKLMPEIAVIGIGVGSALVLGPQRAVELWGKQQVVISLGQSPT